MPFLLPRTTSEVVAAGLQSLGNASVQESDSFAFGFRKGTTPCDLHCVNQTTVLQPLASQTETTTAPLPRNTSTKSLMTYCARTVSITNMHLCDSFGTETS